MKELNEDETIQKIEKKHALYKKQIITIRNLMELYRLCVQCYETKKRSQ